jgi:hypothetical protein
MSRGQVARGPPNAQVEQVITKPLEEAPPNHDPHRSTRSMARATGLSQTAISRIWRALASSRT